MLRRNIILGGANLLALAGSADIAAAAGLPTAEGLPGERVSTDDYVEIFQLYNRYCHAFDTGAGEAWADTYTEDGEFTGGRGPGLAKDDRTPIKGRAALVKVGSTGGTRHFVTNLVVTKTADGAKGSCYLLMYTARTTPDSYVEDRDL